MRSRELPKVATYEMKSEVVKEIRKLMRKINTPMDQWTEMLETMTQDEIYEAIVKFKEER